MEYVTYSLYAGMGFGLLIGIVAGYMLGGWRCYRLLQRAIAAEEQRRGVWCDDEYEAYRKKVLNTPLP